jgi:hypothetical protein
MNRRTAYLAALKYSFGLYLINEGYSPRVAYQHAKRDAAYYAFVVSDRHLELSRPWNVAK